METILDKASKVLKALDLCNRVYGCDACPYNGQKREFPPCHTKLKSDAASLIRSLMFEVANAKDERDAAVADIMSIKNKGQIQMCQYCKNCRGMLDGVPRCDVLLECWDRHTKFEWRGLSSADSILGSLMSSFMESIDSEKKS